MESKERREFIINPKSCFIKQKQSSKINLIRANNNNKKDEIHYGGTDTNERSWEERGGEIGICPDREEIGDYGTAT